MDVVGVGKVETPPIDHISVSVDRMEVDGIILYGVSFPALGVPLSDFGSLAFLKPPLAEGETCG